MAFRGPGNCVNCLCALQVPIAITVSGGVPASVLVAPAVAVLLRLSLACYLQLPLSAVFITGVLSSDISVVPLTVAPSNPANTQTGFCAQVASSSSGVGALRALAAPPLIRRMSAPQATTTVSLVAVSCSGGGAAVGIPTGLQELLNALQSLGVPASDNATTAPGASPAPAPPAPSLFATFLTAAASAASMSPAAITASTPLIGSARAHSSPSFAPAVAPPSGGGTATASSSSASLAVIGGAAAGGALVLALLAVLGFWLVLRDKRRQSSAVLASTVPCGPPAADGGASFVNRMHGAPLESPDDIVQTEKGAAAVAAFKAARIASHRAEQEAQANAAIDGGTPPTVTADGRSVPAARPSRRPAVVKTVFSWQHAAGSGDTAAMPQTNPLLSSGAGAPGTRVGGISRDTRTLSSLHKSAGANGGGRSAEGAGAPTANPGVEFHGTNPLRAGSRRRP